MAFFSLKKNGGRTFFLWGDWYPCLPPVYEVRGKVIICHTSVCLCVCPQGEWVPPSSLHLCRGVPHPVFTWGEVPHPAFTWEEMFPIQSSPRGYPPSIRLDAATPPPPGRRSSTVSTCYAAGGMPLAFTQEDFLV